MMSQHTLKPSHSSHSCSVFQLFFLGLARLQTAENLDGNAVIELAGLLIIITGKIRLENGEKELSLLTLSQLSHMETCHQNKPGSLHVAIFFHSLNQVIEYPDVSITIIPFRVRTGCLTCTRCLSLHMEGIFHTEQAASWRS